MPSRRDAALLLGAAGGFLLAKSCLFRGGLVREWLSSALRPWVLVGSVSQLLVHPVKSGRAHSVAAADCTSLGLRAGRLADRRFMVVAPSDDDGRLKFVTARERPRLVLVNTDGISEEGIVSLSSTEGGANAKCEFSLKQVADTRDVRSAMMWLDKWVDALDCGDEAAAWVSALIGQEGCRLLFWSDALSHRSIDFDPALPKLGVHRSDGTSFADLAAYMLLSGASVRHCEERVASGERFDMRRFRPNIVVEGCQPNDEDKWCEIKIGKTVRFTNIKPCTRCVFTTIDPDKGEMHSRNEPLRTLQKYRLPPSDLRKLFNYAPLFGVNLVVDSVGSIEVGDKVFVRYIS